MIEIKITKDGKTIQVYTEQSRMPRALSELMLLNWKEYGNHLLLELLENDPDIKIVNVDFQPLPF